MKFLMNKQSTPTFLLRKLSYKILGHLYKHGKDIYDKVVVCLQAFEFVFNGLGNAGHY
ncbi:hypothetical protein MBAV_000266 [Candidatus Magnetobacterium bavaricum]|uniref:Uncharacterized protein n=1 Tax=Candidatus Magnetobacterium bavaricum TaxID=29290 RepID=A0A0F3H0C0_9BACT|nr:hypothetical protein MBAV_000266 [Candidatus Magnetobacterium bavaricum]